MELVKGLVVTTSAAAAAEVGRKEGRKDGYETPLFKTSATAVVQFAGGLVFTTSAAAVAKIAKRSAFTTPQLH